MSDYDYSGRHTTDANQDEKTENIVIREARWPDDNSFIYSTFLKCVLYGGTGFDYIDRRQFFAYYPALLDVLLEDRKVDVQVACTESDPNFIVGYAMSQPETSTIHLVYVKELWRKQGVATKLLQAGTWTNYTHQTALGKSIADKKQLTWEPLRLIMTLKGE